MTVDWAEVLSAVLTGVVSYFAGRHRGRKIHRSGDYLHYKVNPNPDEPE